MPLFRPSLHRLAAASASGTRYAAREALKARDTAHATKLPTIPTCPTPTCECAEMPPDLDIERSIDMTRSMAPYSEHLVIPTGQADWKSKIEDEKGTAPWGDFAANVKNALGQKGAFHDPYHNVVVSTASFETPSYKSNDRISRALLFPSFRLVEQVKTDETEIPDFIKTFLLPENLHPSYNQLSEEEKQGKQRDVSRLTSEHWTGKVRSISAPTILICSHNSRDSRCGILGPLLHAEFTQYINKRHSLRNNTVSSDLIKGDPSPNSFASHPQFNPNAIDTQHSNNHPINIGMISHVGGHKFAGTVIVYIPPDYQCQPLHRTTHGAKPHDEPEYPTSNKSPSENEVLDPRPKNLSPLAGKGIWYGRVEPKHVEGIVEQTIGHGQIIRELFRGGIEQDGSLIRV